MEGVHVTAVLIGSSLEALQRALLLPRLSGFRPRGWCFHSTSTFLLVKSRLDSAIRSSFHDQQFGRKIGHRESLNAADGNNRDKKPDCEVDLLSTGSKTMLAK